jgi:hypothetical protein
MFAETFDSWDDPLQAGGETEYAVVVLTLCVGVAYSFAILVKNYVRLSLIRHACILRQQSFLSYSFKSPRFEEISPPLLPLRI